MLLGRAQECARLDALLAASELPDVKRLREEFAPLDAKGLRFRQRSYIFMWRTERDWTRDCRQFLIQLKDGSVHRAEFRFVRSWWGLWPRWDD